MGVSEMIYTCPMHPEVESSKKGKCPKCGGMDLVLKDDQTADTANSYTPLYIIIGLILLSVSVVAWREQTWNMFMMHFMAGFFLVFSGFKLLDLKGFAQGYSTYDLLAQKVYAYGYVYPFLELGLGLAYLIGFVTPGINLFTFFLMTFSGIGVLIKLLKHEKFQCACLGTFLKVSLTKVTLIEDFGMALMALGMLLIK